MKNGWYEGSVFFLIAGKQFSIDSDSKLLSLLRSHDTGILNYKWSQTGLVDGPDRAIAGLLTSLLLGFGAKYIKAGDKGTGVILAVIGALQGLGAKGAAGL